MTDDDRDDCAFLARLARLADAAAGQFVEVRRPDFLRLLRLAGLEDTAVYRCAVRDGQDSRRTIPAALRWLVRIAAREGTRTRTD